MVVAAAAVAAVAVPGMEEGLVARGAEVGRGLRALQVPRGPLVRRARRGLHQVLVPQLWREHHPVLVAWQVKAVQLARLRALLRAMLLVVVLLVLQIREVQARHQWTQVRVQAIQLLLVRQVPRLPWVVQKVRQVLQAQQPAECCQVHLARTHRQAWVH
jgi:hypothetical protein